jgi:hypothetical protein
MHKDQGVAILSVTAPNISCFRLVPGTSYSQQQCGKGLLYLPLGRIQTCLSDSFIFLEMFLARWEGREEHP